MSKNIVKFDKPMFDSLIKGMTVVYKAVSGTLGASGRNVIFREYGKPVLTNDGVTIAKTINLEYETESIGADLIKQAAERTNEEAGDGTSTAVVLSHALVTEGMKKIEQGVNPMKLRREMEASTKAIIEDLKKVARPIESDDELFNIANISVENPEIARLVRDAVKKSGIDGTVIVDESTGISVDKEEIDGMRFDKGYISPYMVTNPEKMECVLEDVFVLVTDKQYNLVTDALPFLEEFIKMGGRKLLIVAEDISGELLATIIANRMKGVLHTVCVKKPYYKETLDDIAVLTGAELISHERGATTLGASHVGCLGKAKKVIVTKDTTVIVGGQGAKAKIDERVSSIKNEIKAAENYERAKLKDRLARLIGGVVIIKVGAPTEAEMKYLKRKIDDAVAATKAAMEEGIVIGGGRCLYDVSTGKSSNDGDEVVRKACSLPIRRIIENCGENPDEILPTLKTGQVFNALTGKVSKDPMKDGIVDPLKVERCALANATSFAALFLTSHACIADVPEPVNSNTPPVVV